MATWFATAGGNIDSAGRWNSAPNGSGSALTWPPASGDVLVCNGYSVTVNVSVTTGQLRVDSPSFGGTTGGGFTISNGVTITADIYGGDGDGSTTYYSVIANNVAFSTIGNVYASNGPAVQNRYTLLLTVGASIAHIGNVYGGQDGSNSRAFYHNSTGLMQITGDVITETGTTNREAIYNQLAGPISIIGNVIADGAIAITNRINGTVTVSGYVQGSSVTAAVNNQARGIVEVGETRSAPNGRGAVTGAFRYASATAAVSKPIINGAQQTLSVLNVPALVPSDTKVRSGIVYGDNGYTGKLVSKSL